MDSVEVWAPLATMVATIIAAVVALAKLGPERQTTLVGAQDTVIDNLREEVERHRHERELAIAELEDRLARDAAHCEAQIAMLRSQVEALEERLRARG